MNDDIAIKVENVSKTFRLPHEKQTSIKSTLINFSKRGYEKQKALNDISFEVKKGEFFGVVGRNGSGKSTLLKMLAGIYQPSEGNITINGKLTPFIELGVGFSPELTGRENVFLNGALLGFSRKEMNAMYDEIVSFAEIERFMDQKLKNYSSGMQVRLAFSIAIRVQNDILLLDEVLAVGDVNFQRKCFETFNEIKNSGRTVIFISHDTGSVKRYCDRAILIDTGDMIAEGTPEEVIDKYNDINIKLSESKLAQTITTTEKPHTKADTAIKIVETGITDAGHKTRNSFKPREHFTVSTVIQANERVNNPVVRIAGIHTGGGAAVFAYSTKIPKLKIGELSPKEKVQITFSMENIFNDCELDIHVSVFDEKEQNMLASTTKATKFTSLGWSEGIVGTVYPLTDVRVSRPE